MNRTIGVLAPTVLVLVAGCSNLIAGRAIVAVPPPGTPIEWSQCETESS